MYFIDNEKEEYYMEVVADSFNKFFVNVGLDLARTIPDHGSSDTKLEKLIKRNPSPMFLTAVDETEIEDIVKKCKNKRSSYKRSLRGFQNHSHTSVTYHSKPAHFQTK